MDVRDILTRPEFIWSLVAIFGVLVVALLFTGAHRRPAKQTSQPGPEPAPSPQPSQPYPQPTPLQVEDVSAASPPTATFADVAGLDDAIAELRDVTEYLRDPGRYEAVGAQMPRGILLYGPPGCGKTLLARALAGETGVPFFYISAAAFVEQYVGLGAARVRQLFEQAKAKAPSIVFIDELDAVGRSRDAAMAGGGREYDHTLNQLLVELDGFMGSSGMLILGATNRPELIDPALLRPGRFDRRIEIGHPDRRGREQVLPLHAASRPFSYRVNWDEVAADTAGLSAAELANLVNEASLLAARRHWAKIEPEDVEEARARVLSGSRSSRLMGEEEKQLVAVHEAGHALLSMLLKGMETPSQVSIVSRTGSFDRSVWSGTEDRETLTKRELMAQLIVLLGGRAAELNAFGEPSTRAEDDLEHAGDLARNMVERWAMTGRFDLAGSRVKANSPQPSWGPGGQEVGLLLAKAEQAARIILRDNAKRLHAIARVLVERETLTAAELEQIGVPRSNLPVLRVVPDTRAG
jgi:cell division protease FtsH